MKKKIVWLPYDFDTAIGINNEGELVFGYELEDIDHLDGGTNVFNGQDSVIWQNIRLAFFDELREMYQQLRSQGKLSYNAVEKAFEDHQSKWPEALFNEDSYFCYLEPLMNGSGNYLEMLQGNKEEQRKWWLYNRFRYIDSKYNAGDALTDLIQLRAYAKSDITITPYADIYSTVKYGSYIVQERGQRNVAATLKCPVDTLNDTEVYIYSASQLASVGDLSGLKVGFADFSMAIKLQNLKLGDSATTYENPNLKVLYLGNNVLLKTIDVRNCTSLGTSDMKSVDISGCTNIEKVYFDNTKISSVTLPIGGILQELSVPNTITNLTIRNQPKLTTFKITSNNYSNISTCRIENTDYFVKNQSRIEALVNGLATNCRLRLVGVYIDWLEDTDAISAFYDKLDKFRGLDINGNNLDDAYVEGTIHINSATGDALTELKSRYPYLNVVADHTTSYRYFKEVDNTTTYSTVTCIDGVPQSSAPSGPSKPSTQQYTYTFVGWNSSPNQTTSNYNHNAITKSDVTYYPAYTATLQKYPVYFVRATADGGGTLQTISDVAYGTVITAANSYTGSTPTTTQGSADDYPFEGWSPASATVTGSTTFTAKFGSPIDVSEITDSWDTIGANIDNGTYKTKYKVGQYKPLDLGSEGTINMQIVGIDADETAGGSKIPLSFIGMELLATTHSMNSTDTTVGGWEASGMRSYLTNTILPLIPSNVASRINAAKKYSSTYENGALVKDGQITYDMLWIPGHREVFNSNDYETQGVVYSSIYKDATSRIKKLNGFARNWWTRSAGSASGFRRVDDDGSGYGSDASYTRGAVLGFCLGFESETISDTWEQIHNAVTDGSYKTKYSIGDTKAIDLGTYGTQLMEIVAFDEDDKADGSGKAPISWISKNIITTHAMNSSQKTYNGETAYTAGGWENSDMRSWLKSTIKPLIPEAVTKYIVEVTKVSATYTGGAIVKDGQTTTDDVWIPGNHEVFSTNTNYESTGAAYSSKFTNATSRIKKRNDSAYYWWTRSAYSAVYFRGIGGYGNDSDGNAYSTCGAVLGFCTE